MAFAQIVAILMRSAAHKRRTLEELERLVMPPLLARQFAIAEVKAKADSRVPASSAMVLWASVSSDVDKKLAQNLKGPINLRRSEWQSGEIVWVIEAAGDPRVISRLLKQLGRGPWKGREDNTVAARALSLT